MTLFEFLLNPWFHRYLVGALIHMLIVRTYQRYKSTTDSGWFADESEWILYLGMWFWPAVPPLAVIAGVALLVWFLIDRLGMAISYLIVSLTQEPKE